MFKCLIQNHNPYFTGFKIYFDSTKPVGKRLVAVYALCQKCRVPQYEKIDPEADYSVSKIDIMMYL